MPGGLVRAQCSGQWRAVCKTAAVVLRPPRTPVALRPLLVLTATVVLRPLAVPTPSRHASITSTPGAALSAGSGTATRSTKSTGGPETAWRRDAAGCHQSEQPEPSTGIRQEPGIRQERRAARSTPSARNTTRAVRQAVFLRAWRTWDLDAEWAVGVPAGPLGPELFFVHPSVEGDL